jgi:hypothetical protein
MAFSNLSLDGVRVKELWRRSTALLLKHPILWVPVICADLVSFGVDLPLLAAARTLSYGLIHQFMPVLSQGGTIPISPQPSLLFSYLQLASLAFAGAFIRVCLYAFALLIVASLVKMAIEGGRPVFGRSLRAVRPDAGRGIGFAAKIFGLGIVLVDVPIALFATVAPLLSHGTHQRSLLTSHIFRFCWTTLLTAALAYLVTPSALRLLRPRTQKLIECEKLRMGRLFAMLVAAASVAIESLCQTAVRTVSASSSGRVLPSMTRDAMGLGGSLLSAIPFAVVVVALALLADGLSGDESMGTEADRS